MRIEQIQIGERVRKDMGDLSTLAESIKRHGLLHPVVVKPDGSLVAGHRRIEAVRLLGWDDIPVTVIDVDDLLTAERDENTERKDFTPTEAVAIGRLIEEQERPAALARLRSGRPYGDSSQGHRTVADIAAESVGMARQKYTQAKAVVDAADADPQAFGDLPEKMDQTGSVHGAYREMERRKNGHPEPGRRSFRKDKDAPFEIKTARHKQVAEKQKERMVRALSTATGLSRGLQETDVKMVLAVCTDEEIKTWVDRCKSVAREFRAFADKLGG